MIDPSELIKGLCVCAGFQWQDVSRISVTPFEIEFTVLARNSAGKMTGTEQHSYSLDSAKFNG